LIVMVIMTIPLSSINNYSDYPSDSITVEGMFLGLSGLFDSFPSIWVLEFITLALDVDIPYYAANFQLWSKGI